MPAMLIAIAPKLGIEMSRCGKGISISYAA